jgi:UDPglucose 6-dehydrogenase
MRITVAGTGYVGLVTGACLADSGNHVLCLDIDEKKINLLKRGESPIYEPGLADLLRDNIRGKRLTFTTALPEAVRHGQVVFLAIGTPPGPDGAADLTALFDAARNIAPLISEPKIIVNKSTVPVGTGQRVEQLIRDNCPHEVHVVSNPEFLKEGTAVDDFLRPDRVVIGAEDEHAAQIIRELYLPFVRNRSPIIIMRRAAAELTKYAANCFLAARISFINEIANICEKHGIDVNQVREGLGTDRRIGFQFLYPGVGYGGSCFPKDVQAMSHVAREAGLPADLFELVHRINERQRHLLFEKIRDHFSGQLLGRRFAMWGVTFKPKTDDIREAPALTIIQSLLDSGAEVHASDPQGLDNLRAEFGERVQYFEGAYDALNGCDALVVVTEWNEYRSPDFERLSSALQTPLIFDGRNLYEPATMARHGFVYYSIGRPTIWPA